VLLSYDEIRPFHFTLIENIESSANRKWVSEGLRTVGSFRHDFSDLPDDAFEEDDDESIYIDQYIWLDEAENPRMLLHLSRIGKTVSPVFQQSEGGP
jgi:hypothetical protein